MLRMIYKLKVWSNKMWVLVVELKANTEIPILYFILNRIQAMFPFTYYKLKANTNLKKANLNLT